MDRPTCAIPVTHVDQLLSLRQISYDTQTLNISTGGGEIITLTRRVAIAKGSQGLDDPPPTHTVLGDLGKTECED